MLGVAILCPLQVLRLPRVALLFLTRGPMPHERTWQACMGWAQGQIPLQAVHLSGVCDPSISAGGSIQQVLQACGRGRRGAGTRSAGQEGRPAWEAILEQHLFSVYVHAPPDFPGWSTAPAPSPSAPPPHLAILFGYQCCWQKIPTLFGGLFMPFSNLI